mgnify:CR=1 FL=1
MNTTLKIITAGLIAFSINGCASHSKETANEHPIRQSLQGRTQGGPPTNGQAQGRPQGGPPSFTQLLEEMDANKDGKLSKSEVRGPLQIDFEKIDADKDGFLTEKEIANAPRPQRPAPRN